MNNDLRIVFMGTPAFAVASLEHLLHAGCHIVGVVTAPDKPAGRGLKIQESEVKKFAASKNLRILQPEKLQDPAFIHEMKTLQADLFIVVAFRMLPEVIWKMAPLGTFNLHASLLPQYRGAAPINWAIIHGEKETGVTTFFINNTIDTGNILFSEKVQIQADENAGALHDKLMKAGAELVYKTVQSIQNNSYHLIPQENLFHDPVKPAPKIFKADCRIHWNRDAEEVYDFIRGLSPYPGAFTEFVSANNERFHVKIYKASVIPNTSNVTTGQMVSDGKSHICIAAKNALISIEEMQLMGKKKMPVVEFLRGFSMDGISIT